MNAQKIVALLYRKGAHLSVDNGNLYINGPDEAFDNESLKYLKEFKADIIEFLNKLNGSSEATVVEKFHHPTSYVCATSLAQKRMLFVEELAGNKSYYNIPIAYRISGFLNKAALFKAFSRLVARHDVLRAVYALEGDTYIQYISQISPLRISEVSIINEPSKSSLLKVLLEQEAHYQFNLTHEWPIRVSLFECGKNEHILSINIHHIAADGWSARNIINEVSTGYQLYKKQLDQELVNDVEREYQYADYINWQAAWEKSQHYQEAKSYWLSSLKGAPELHSLPTDFVRPNIQSVAGDFHTQIIPELLAARVALCARSYKTTPFVIFQAVFAAFLARYSGESDIVFGTAAANRQPIEFINTVGLFVNTLALRYSIFNNTSFDDLIKQAIEVSAQALRFQQFPFDLVIDALQPVRSLGYNPLIQVMLVMQDDAASDLTLEGTEVVQFSQRQNVSKFDLSLHIYANRGSISINWEYRTSLFKLTTIQSMTNHFATLLDACLSFPEQNIHTIQMVAFDATTSIINTKNFPTPICVHELFERQVNLSPESIAVREGDIVITYNELNAQADLVASHLYSACAGQIGRIGLCMEKSAELLVGLLAIMKIGAVYVPLDSYYPKERLDWMIQDSGIGILLTSIDTILPAELNASTRILQIQSLLEAKIALQYIPVNNLDFPAYIIYTSGSTGKPKGVLVSHRSLFYSLHANQTVMAITSTDLIPTIGSQSFGISLLEIFLPLISGGEVLIVKKYHVTDLQELIQRTHDVTVLHAVPSLMRQWLDIVLAANNPKQYPRLRLLLVGGESVSDSLLQKIKQWRPEIRLLELYGMTESAVVCSSYAANEFSHTHYCIGKPHENTRFYVMNLHGQQQPLGVPGELHIGGLSLASEYINQSEMTAEKFILSQFLPGERLYKTGDRVRLLDDGNYEFLGRVDHQVSLRGIRIELGEIETLATGVEGVGQAVAYVAEVGSDEKTLVLYYTSCADELVQTVLTDGIRRFLTQNLPDYMCPSLIQRLESFPLNPNGKVDRKKLPSPNFVTSIVAPETDIERRLVELWKAILQCDSISVTANFFEMGGHSLMASKLAIQIRAAFSIAFPLSTLFESPSIRSSARHIEKELKEKYAKKIIKTGIVNEFSDHEKLTL